MKLQLQMFVQHRVDETTATNVCDRIGLMKPLQLQMFETTATKYDRVDETTATNVCIGQG